MGLADEASKKIGDDHPESALRDITSISQVDERSYEEYLRIKQSDRIHTEERRGGFIYYAVEEDRDVPFPDGSSAFVTVIERFKTKAPSTQ